MNYNIKEVKEDPKDTIITKSGLTVDFTIRDIESNIEFAKKQISGLDEKVKIYKATMANVERTHPHIAEMSKEDLTAAYLYREAMGFVTEAEDKIVEFKNAIEADEKSLIEAIEETGIKI